MPHAPDNDTDLINTVSHGLLSITTHIDPATGDRCIRLTLQDGTYRDITPDQARTIATQIHDALPH